MSKTALLAAVAMMASELLALGVGHLTTIRAELRRWMEDHEYDSIAQMRGCLSRRAAPDPTAYERSNYMRVLSSYSMKKVR